MASAEQLKALIRCHAEGDDERFYSVALQVAANAARNGHGKLASELRAIIDKNAERAPIPSKPTPIAQPKGELAALLHAKYAATTLREIAMPDAQRVRLQRVLDEQHARVRLRAHGLAPMRKLLLVGPPGTGKTMTASAIASDLSIALFSVRLEGLISRFLGETAAKLRLVFDAMASARGVYFFDEFDALGGERGAGNDVAELRRVLNSFLQFLEQDESDSVVIAATNHKSLLDRALFRRFDAVIEYALPDERIAEQVLRARLSTLDTSALDWPSLARFSLGLSHAELAAACDDASKRAILADQRAIDADALRTAIEERRAAR
jgi:SpoVK/Ycf46/Vps4 family AAA+-type ATPase